MKILRFKNPLVANAHMLTSITNQIDPNTKVYFHLDWLKPGRHTFIINHDNDNIKFNDKEEKEEQKGLAMLLSKLKKPKNEPEKP